MGKRIRQTAAYVTALAVIGAVAIAGNDELDRRKSTEATVAALVVLAEKTEPRLTKLERNQVLYTWCSENGIARGLCPVEK